MSELVPHPAQMSLLAARRLGNLTANSGRIFRLDGPLDPDRLAEAYRAAAQEHDALRLHLTDRDTWQTGDQARIDVRLLDHRPSRLPVTSTMQAILDDFHQELGRLYDLAHGLIGHITVHRVADRAWVVTEIIDHALADGRSMPLLFNTVAAIYRGDRHDRPGSFAQALAAQVADEAAGAYWRRRYADFTAAPQARLLPDQEPVHTVPRLRLHLTPAQTAVLARAARASHATVPAILMAAHAHTTARLQGTGDLSIHVAVDTRTDEHLDTVGQFAHVLPLRLAIPWNSRLPEYIRVTHRAILEARDHVMVAPDQLHDAGAPTLAAPGATAFVMQAVVPPGAPSLPGITISPITADSTPQGAALSTVVRPLDDGSTTVEVTGRATDPLATDLGRWAGTFRQFLHTLADEPDTPLCSDQLLSPTDRASVQAMAIPTPSFTGPPLYESAVRQLSRTDRTVILDTDTACTGPQLLKLASATAEALQHAGARRGSEVLVGGLRLADRAAAWLACLRLGCTYIPYDDKPPARPAALRLDRAGVHPTMVPPTEDQDVLPAPPAYVIHTSGSTGRPKGVAVGLAALTNLIHGEQDRFSLDSNSRVLLVAPPTVDPWICHVTTALVLGATLIQGDPIGTMPLTEQLRHHRITHCFLPAGLLRSLDPDMRLPDLKMIASAGDSCRRTDLDRFAPARTFNIYGPTEATVTATVHESIPGAGDPVPIGWPIRGLATRVVIDRAATAPPGTPGELALTGAGLADGYLNQPELTAGAFHALPGTAGLWYFTGDRAVHTPAGLVHLGRIDRQVKIRGHRVELDALENQATRTGLCTAARALANRHDDSVRLLLFAESCPDTEELTARLRQLLPPSHWPHQVIQVDSVPAHPSGKPDDDALVGLLPQPMPQSPQPGSDGTVLGRLWRHLLRTTPGPGSHFFQDGGDSLTVLHLLTRLRQAGLQLTSADVYQYPCYRDLEGRLSRGRAQGSARHRSPRFPLTPTGRWMHQLNIPAWRRWTLRHSIDFDRMPPAAQLASALERLVESTPALRCRSDRRDQFLTVVSPYQPLVVTVAESDPAPEQLRQALAKTQHSVNPVTGRMLAVLAVQRDDGSARLVLFGHHLAVDPWSWTAIRRRLALALDGANFPEDQAYQELAELTEHQTAAGHYDAEAGLWRTILGGGLTTPQNPLTSRLRQTSITLPSLNELTRRWQHSPAAVLLAATGQALGHYSGGQPTVIDLERNGRSHPELDLSDAVGWFGLHHPVLAPYLPTAEAIAHLASELADVPDQGAGYGALRWSGRADLGSTVGRVAVDIQDTGASPDALEQRIQALAPANPAPLTPYPLALTFRAGEEGTTATLSHGDTTSPQEAASILKSVTTAIGTPEDLKPTRPTRRQQRALQAHASAMQQLMLHFAGCGSQAGVYLPRQMIHLSVPPSEQGRFLKRLEHWLDGLDVLHRRFHTDTRTATIIQRWIPDTRTCLRIEPGDRKTAHAWMAAPPHIDVQQASHGAPLATMTAFTGDAGLFLCMETHHALLDGHSNRHLLHQLALLADGSPLPPGPTSAPVLRHLGREAAASAVARPSPPLTGALKQPDEHHLVIPAQTVRACRARAAAQHTNLRACLAALTGQAVAADETTTLYLVANGRDNQIAHANDAWGMLWYFSPVPLAADEPAQLQQRVYTSEAASLAVLRRTASGWRQWDPASAVSFNFVAAPRPARNRTQLAVLQSRDRFHWPRQITAVIREDDQLDLRLCTLDGASAAALLQRAGESVRQYAAGADRSPWE